MHSIFCGHCWQEALAAVNALLAAKDWLLTLVATKLR